MTSTLGIIFILLAIYALASASGIFAERSGTINLSIEGGMTMGALGYIIIVTKLTNNGLNDLTWLIALAGVVVGAIFGLMTTMLLSITAINLRGNQVVIGMAINIMVPIISLIVIVFITTGNYYIPMTRYQITTAIITELKPWQIQLIIASIVTLIIGVLFVIINKTRFGLRLRAAGENPHALEAVGVSVVSVRHMAMMISGTMAGLAGALAVSSYSKYSSFSNSTLGMGYIAIAILILGKWRLQTTIIGSLFFASAFAIVDYYSVELSSYKHLLATIPYAMTILMLPFLSMNSNVPKYVGQPYRK